MKRSEGVRLCACPPLPAVTFRLLCPSLGACEALLLEGGWVVGGWREAQKKGLGWVEGGGDGGGGRGGSYRMSSHMVGIVLN